MITSSICKASDFRLPFIKPILSDMRVPFSFHRKYWEYAMVVQILTERGMIGKSGLGFACGQELLPAYLLSKGCQIMATDLDIYNINGWGSAQSFPSIEDYIHALNYPSDYSKLTCRSVDMNNIPEDLNEKFDFNWSICSFEHCGSIQKGMDFIVKQMDTLKKGGVAIHSAEYNLSSNTDTVDNCNTVLYTRPQIEELIKRLEDKGYKVSPMDWIVGTEPEDFWIVTPGTPKAHLKVFVEGYVSTSYILIIEK